MHLPSPAIFVFALAIILMGALPGTRAATAQTVPSEVSIRHVQTGVATGPNDPCVPYIKRAALQPAETAEEMQFEVALKMRNFAELQTRVGKGERIPFREMAVKYYPTGADYQAVADWLTSQGFKITRKDDNHLAIFARATVSSIQKALQVNFARVSLEGKEYTSAITAPAFPVAISPMLVGINGLQPHLHARPHSVQRQAAPNSLTGTGEPYLPSQILHAYNTEALTVTGSGQSIAIVINTFPDASDLTTFWSTYGVSQSINNISFIQVLPGPLPAPGGEESLDAEWASSMAPGAQVRIYATADPVTDLLSSHFDVAYQQVFADAVAHPEYGIHQMTMSYGEGELSSTYSQILTDSQYFANLASAGVTLFASSGDGGSTPGGGGFGDTSGSPQVESPASDPNVTGVGGTLITLTSGTNIDAETGWTLSGGGFSDYFSRPTWQTGTGVPAGSTRCVPDVAAPSVGAPVILNGAQYIYEGTSWSSPIWAGLCALINHARANVNLAPVGLLGPWIYPLIGTSNFNDITSGNNGYSAGTGYDLVTGIGSPNMQNLVQTLVGVQTTPGVTTLQPGQNATFAVASNATATGYQWQRLASGNTIWTSVADSGPYAGSTTGSLTINGTTLAMSGDQFQCVITNGTNVTTTAPPSVLVVDNPLVVTTLAGQVLTSGTSDGAGSGAQFAYPSGVAVDSSGNLWIADFNNSTIRRVTPFGVVTTPYGQPGVSGTNDGTGNNALFNTPNAVAIDAFDNIYVADSGNSTIRKITPAGVVSTLAGTGLISGSTDGEGASALFNNPQGIAVDGSGNVYVADTWNETIRKITASGSVSTLAGTAGTYGYLDATGTNALFNYPVGIAVDSLGKVYVTDLFNYVVREITPAAVVTTPYGQAAAAGRLDGIGAGAQFNSPIGIAVDASNNLYVTDSQVPPVTNSISSGNNTLRRITPGGVVSTIAGSPGVTGSSDGTGAAAQFYSVQAVSVNSSGVVYLADTFNQTLRAGGIVPLITTLPGSQTITSGQPVTFSAGAIGSGLLTYQWYKNGVAIPGANSSTYTITAASVGDAANYYVTVTDPYGTAASSSFTLNVNTPIPAMSRRVLAILALMFFAMAARFLTIRNRGYKRPL
jgi:kumamolisin